MNHVSQLRRLVRSIKALASDDRGNVAMIFGLSLIPLIGFLGAAIDYSRANNARTAMQAALDSTSLMLSKDATKLSPADLTTKASGYFNAIFKHPEAESISVNATYGYSGMHKIDMTSTADVPTAFMRVLGINTIRISSTATSAWGGARVRVALALDTTGSMAQANKMNALKPAAKKLIKILQDTAKTPGDVYVSIVPFSKDVNVGPGNYNQNWIKWDDWDNRNGTCSSGSYSTRSSCQNNGRTWTPRAHSTWNGCVMDRDQSYDQRNDKPTTMTPGTLFWAEQHGDCPASLLELRDVTVKTQFDELNAKIDSLFPDGNTNQGIGLAWAWQTLSDGPFSYPAHDPNFVYEKFVVLMSDGANTENRWSTNTNTINARQATLCEIMKDPSKAPGAALTGGPITIFAVQVETSGGGEQAVMRNCASEPKATRFKKISNADQLESAFTDIATQISKLRLMN